MQAALFLLCALACLPDSLASEGTASDAWSAARLQCHRVLHGVAAAGHTDFELAVHCRARLPMELCSRSREFLGPQPWSQARIQATCSHWETERKDYGLSFSPERRLQDARDVKVILDEVLDIKAGFGLVAKGRVGTASRDLNGVLKLKTELTKDFEETLIKKVEFWKKTALALEKASEKATGHTPRAGLIRGIVGILDAGLSTPSRSETLTRDDKAVGEIVHYDRPMLGLRELGWGAKSLAVPALGVSQMFAFTFVVTGAVALMALRVLRFRTAPVSEEPEDEQQTVACE